MMLTCMLEVSRPTSATLSCPRVTAMQTPACVDSTGFHDMDVPPGGLADGTLGGPGGSPVGGPADGRVGGPCGSPAGGPGELKP